MRALILLLAFARAASAQPHFQVVLDDAAPQLVNLSGDLPVYDAYPFKDIDDFRVISKFLANFYTGANPWIAADYTAHVHPTNLDPIGDLQLKPAKDEPVGPAFKASPRWMLAEAWRVSNVLQAVLAAAKPAGTKTPVAQFLAKQDAATPLGKALFPPDIRALLTANEFAITKAGTEWLGFKKLPAGSLAPFKDVKVAHAAPSSGIGFYQRGAVGPLSLEAAFLLASQVAGLDWTKVAARTAGSSRFWWVAGFAPPPPGQKCGGTRMTDLHDATVTFAARPAAVLASGDPRGGFNLLIDVDHDRTDDAARNVFFFAVHSIDVHSRVHVPTPAALKALTYTSYAPPKDEVSTPLPGAQGAPPAGPAATKESDKNAQNIRFFAHAHAAVLPYTQAMQFIGQRNGQCELMDNYAQAGFLHMYVLSEDEDALWPRRQYLK